MLPCLRAERGMAVAEVGRLKVLVVPEPFHVHHIPVLLIFTSTGQLELISSG